jgi:hypothetical protein
MNCRGLFHAEKVSHMPRGLVVLLGIGLLGLLPAGCRDTSSADGEPSFREQIAQAKRETDTELRAKQLIRIGYQQGKAKDVAGAEETLRMAWDDCNSIADPAAKASALALMAEAEASEAIGNSAAAKRAINAATEAVAKVELPEDKPLGMARVAQAQAVADSVDAALATLKSAEKAVGKIDDLQGKTLAICAIAKAYHKIAKPAERDRVLRVALDLANAAGDVRKRSLAQAEVAAKQTDFDQRAAAKTFDSALESAGKIDDPYSKVYALGDIAKRLSEAGQRAKTHAVLNQAERLAEKIPQPDMQMQALQYIRSLMGKLPKPQ